MQLGLWLSLGFFLVGILLFQHSVDLIGSFGQTKTTITTQPLDRNVNVIEYLLSLFSGLFLMGISLAYISVKFRLNPSFLSILDWSLILFCLLLMPVFETLGLDPYWWIVLILIPTVFATIGLHAYLKRYMSKTKN